MVILLYDVLWNILLELPYEKLLENVQYPKNTIYL